MNARDIACTIVKARKALVRGFVARDVLDVHAQVDQAEFVALVRSLPMAVRWNGQLLSRFDAPARRRIERAGILAAYEWARS